MKLQASELRRRYSSKLTPLAALAFLLIILPIYCLFYNENVSPKIRYQQQQNAIMSTDPLPEPNNHTWRSRIHAGDTSPPNPSQLEAITGLAAANQAVDKTPEPKSPGQARTGSTRRPESNGNGSVIISEGWRDKKCDLFNGEWIPNPEGPYYTNETCSHVLESQNCMKFGRPDTGFLRWRWKPDECELPVFDPVEFLEMVRGKSILFVGDSVARNHMHSLICLLSRVARPVDDPLGEYRHYQYTVNKQYKYVDYAFNISFQWSPFLVKIDKVDPTKSGPYYLHLDEFDESWTTKLALHDFVIISAGHWFVRPSYLHLHGRLHGCVYCSEPESNIPHLPPEFSYRHAFRTAFRAINDAAGFDGVTFVRTFAPQHFEGGAWDNGGNCPRTRPFTRNESEVAAAAARGSLEFYTVQLEEMRIAEKAGRRDGGKFVLFDATKPMTMRPDGHPSKYGHLPGPKWEMPNDCVHWCLPGPIDAWSDFLQELLKREIGDDT